MALPQELIDGYRRFMAGGFEGQRDRYRQLAEEGQKPRTMVVACCDSRAAPELVFDAPPGEMFVVRNVANLVPHYTTGKGINSTSAALEYAVQVLKVEHIVVMGHGRCGGIAASLTHEPTPLSPGDFIGKWMGLIRQQAEDVSHYDHLSASERQTMMERISVRNSLENLRSFPCVSILEGKGKIHLSGAWFDISTGELWVMDPESGDFRRPE